MSYKLGREDSYTSRSSAEARVSCDYSEEDGGMEVDAEGEEKGDGDLVLLQPTAEEAWSMPRAEAKGEEIRTSPGKGAKLVQQLNLSALAVPSSTPLASHSRRAEVIGEGRDYDYDEPNIQENTVLVRMANRFVVYASLVTYLISQSVVMM
jgi:hypothetical protein